MTSETLLKMHFVALTMLGGCLLGGVSGTESLAAIAFSAGIFSLIFVDWLQWVYLPPAMAYALMGVASVYCIGGFWSGVDHLQIAAVARLLVLVQAVLHLQRKNRRVLEQLSVFALLELIVAAVLNDAIVFGILLVPFSIIGLSTMIQFQAYTCDSQESPPSKSGTIVPHSQTASKANLKISRRGIVMLGPAVVFFAAVFFYALPRTDGKSIVGRSQLQVSTGYTDRVRFEQMGRLLQNPEKVMRIDLHDLETHKPYTLIEPIYLRGQVLERYDWDSHRDMGEWFSVRRHDFVGNFELPREPITSRNLDQHDRVEISFRVEPTNSAAVFSVPPYFTYRDDDQLRHWPRRWLLNRRSAEPITDRIGYSLITHALNQGRQSRFFRFVDHENQSVFGNNMGPWQRQLLLEIERDQMPSLVEEAQQVADLVRDRSEFLADVALAMENHLARSGRYRYSTDLSDNRPRDVNPMEYFIAETKRGHCQYYASALALMLRSQGIPARLVVGYKSDEYNAYGNYYLVRQLHAHAWTEAYFEPEQLPPQFAENEQCAYGGVWMRLDATPANDDDLSETANMSHMMDFAQILWDEYVLDMNKSRQSAPLQELGKNAADTTTYQHYIAGTRDLFDKLKRGDLAEAMEAIDGVYSWRVTLVSVLVCMGAIMVWRNAPPLRMWVRRVTERSRFAGDTGIAFFDRLCHLLASAGVKRENSQTPLELAACAQSQLQCDAQQSADLNSVIEILYDQRYGKRTPNEATNQRVETAIAAVEQMIAQQRENAKLTTR